MGVDDDDAHDDDDDDDDDDDGDGGDGDGDEDDDDDDDDDDDGDGGDGDGDEDDDDDDGFDGWFWRFPIAMFDDRRVGGIHEKTTKMKVMVDFIAMFHYWRIIAIIEKRTCCPF